MERIIFLFLILGMAGCASYPERKEPPADFPKDAVMFRFSYSTAFDKVVAALQSNGYDLAIEDRRGGVIQTYPKEMGLAPEGSPVKFKGVYMIRLDGDANRSWGVIRFALLPELPGEREKLIRDLQGEGPAAP